MSVRAPQRSTADGAASTAAPSASPRRSHIPGEAGIWIFILGDMTLYGALFVSFLYDRGKDPALFNHAAGTLHPAFGAVNTLLLLTSSILVVFGMRSMRDRLSEHGPRFFRLAFLCGAGFVVVKYFEYSSLLRAGHAPTDNAFYTYYYVLT